MLQANKMFRAFGMVQRLQIIIVFLWSYIVPMLCYENPKLTMDLLSSGFHRDLKYVVVFPELQGQQNTFLIKQPLPASVYVSTDQLDDLQRQDKIRYFIENNHVDIEKPTEASKSFDILIYGNTAFMQTISLPIHFRYHAPAQKSFVTVGIDYPKLLLQSTENFQPLNATQQVMHMCKDLRHRCRWIPVEYDNFSRRSITAHIPIGNASLSATVTYCTIALSWVASIFIIYELWKKNRALRVRLTTKLLKSK